MATGQGIGRQVDCTPPRRQGRYLKSVACLEGSRGVLDRATLSGKVKYPHLSCPGYSSFLVFAINSEPFLGLRSKFLEKNNEPV